MSIARNAGLNLASQSLNAVLPTVISVLVARLLMPAGAGRYSYLTYLAAIGVSVATLGLPSAVTRFTALFAGAGDGDAARRTGAWLVRTGMRLSLLTGGAVLLAAWFGARPVDTSMGELVLVGLLIPLSAAGIMLGALIAGQQRFGTLLRVGLVLAPITFTANLCALILVRTVFSLLLAQVIVAAIQALLLRQATRGQEYWGAGRPNRAQRREVWSYLAPVSATVILDVVVWQRSEVLFLQYYSSNEQIAFYALPFALVSRVMLLLPGALTGVLLPRFSSELGAGSARGTIETYRQAVLATAWLAAPLAAAGIVLASPLLQLLYGSAFNPAAPIFRLLLVSGAFAAIAGVGAAAAYGGGKQNFVLKSSAATAAVNIALDFVLIPSMAAAGAAVANGAAQLVGLAIGFTYLKRSLGLRLPGTGLARVAAVSLLATLAASAWLLTPLSAAPLVAGGSTTFLLVYLSLSRLLPEELRRLQRVGLGLLKSKPHVKRSRD